jgi:drug/metabolite transporter (DMT)-like permease
LIYLLAASLLWAFSFGLINQQLVGIDPVLLAFLRLCVSVLAFAPLLPGGRLHRNTIRAALGLGALQFGAMYVLYLASFAYLPAYGVALLTVFTPLYVVLLDDLRRRRVSPRHLAAASLAVAGAVVAVGRGVVAAPAWPGIVLVQASNLCFAAGQLGYRHRFGGSARRAEAALLGWMYVGAAAVTGVAAALTSACNVGAAGTAAPRFDAATWGVILYLGLLPTALGFYWWNKGAARTDTGILAVSNNLKVPLAVLVSWLVFGESAAYARVLGGLAIIITALWLAEPDGGRTASPENRTQRGG